jgi:hypothetical protein
LAEDSPTINVKVTTKLDEEIVRFDSVLDRIQKMLFEDMNVLDLIVEIRERIYRLHNLMHGCEIVEFTSNEPWIEPADIFWDKKKQNFYDNEEDDTLRGGYE